jgi:hypothetical protein
MPEFNCSREVLLPASPEQVWRAVATTEGNAGWLFPNAIDPAGAGAKAWDPPRRFAIRQEQGEWFNELDFVIEGRGDGTSSLHYAHCGVFPPDAFDTQNEAIQQHTDFYLHTLGEYLAHFAGRPAAYVGEAPRGIEGPPGSATPDGFERLQRALGLPAGAAEGEHVQLSPAGLEPIDGVIDYLQENFIGIRSDDALYCFFGRNAFGGPVAVSIHSFDGRDADSAKQRWQEWLAGALG